MKMSLGAGGMRGNGARVGRAHSHLNTTFVLQRVFFSFWCWRVVSFLSEAHLKVMRGWREAAGGTSQPRERTEDISEIFKYFVLQQGTWISPGYGQIPHFLAASHSITCGDSIRSICLTVFILPLPRGGFLSCRW